MLFDVRTSERDGWQVAGVVGDLDLATLPSLRAAVDALDGPAAAVDLTAAGFVDVVAFGVVLGARLRAVRRGGRFVVVCPPGGPRDLLAESGVDRLVEVVAALPPAAAPSGAG